MFGSFDDRSRAARPHVVTAGYAAPPVTQRTALEWLQPAKERSVTDGCYPVKLGTLSL